MVIAENSADAKGVEWTLSPAPILEIRALDGEDAYLFQRIRGVIRLSDGRIALVDNRAGDLRVYSPTGEHLATFGRRGEGPGEFASPALLGKLPGDTLVVVDWRHRRIDLFHPDRGFVRDATASAHVPGILLAEGMFSPGSILHQRRVFEEDRSDGYARRKVHYRVVALDGSLEADYGEFEGEEIVTTTQTDGAEAMSIMGDAPLGKGTAVAVAGPRFYYGSQDEYEVLVRRQDGSLERVIRYLKPFTPVTPAHIQAYEEKTIEDLAELEDNDLSRAFRREMADAPIPDFHPAFGEIYVDDLGFLWVEETRPTEETPRRCSVFDGQGRLVAWAGLPDGLRITEIGPDHVLGSFADELNVQYLRMYRLTREGGPAPGM